MLIILSPAKKQAKLAAHGGTKSQIIFKSKSHHLIKYLKLQSRSKIKALMSISDSLSDLNYQRFQDFDSQNYTDDNAAQAVFLFQGDAYKSLDAISLTEKQLAFAQDHLLLLSGLYGALRPLDLIQPYRLEMKTKLATDHAKNLYEYWQADLTQLLNQRLEKASAPLVNLASVEYSNAIDFKQLNMPYVNVHFKQQQKNQFRSIGILTKRARGLMTRYLITKKAKTVNTIKQFSLDSYQFQPDQSDHENLTFYQIK
jgi:uncharacterized protein